MTSPDPDRYASVETGPEIEVRDRGSRFLGRVFRVEGEDEVSAHLAAVRKRYYDATHHCWAARIGDPDHAAERSDDDGEPSGTAGAPILGAIRHADVTDALVVVTRYFGGTKLGTGGLVRAYGEAARAALDAAPRRTIWRETLLIAAFDYPDLGTMETTVGKAGDAVRAVERVFEPAPVMRLTVKASRAEALRAALIEATSGRVRLLPGPP